MLTPTQRDERVLIVWSDSLDQIVPLVSEFEQKIMKLVWRCRPTPTTSSIVPSSGAPSIIGGSNVNLTEKHSQPIVDAATAVLEATEKAKPKPKKRGCWGWGGQKDVPASGAADPEKAGPQPRPVRLFAPFYGGLGLGLSVCE